MNNNEKKEYHHPEMDVLNVHTEANMLVPSSWGHEEGYLITENTESKLA